MERKKINRRICKDCPAYDCPQQGTGKKPKQRLCNKYNRATAMAITMAGDTH